MSNETFEYRIDEVLETEVFVIGSGVAGCCAAIEAARMGCDVILIEKDNVLGGNSGPNLGVHVSGAGRFHAYADETGIVGEIEEECAWRAAKIHTPGLHYNIGRMYETVLYEKLKDAGVRVFRSHLGKYPIVKGRRIIGVIVEDIATYKTKRINISHFLIEASGDGHVAAEAGAEFMHGREGKEEFGERSAPEKEDNLTMGTSMTALLHDCGTSVPFLPPEGVEPLPETTGKPHFFSREPDLVMVWPTEHGGQAHLDTIEKHHEIYQGLLFQMYSYWNRIKNGSFKEDAASWEMVWVSPKAGKRESRRFIGDYIVTQKDVETPTQFSDAVAYGGFAIDVHEPQPNGRSIVHFYSLPPLYGIPFRSLYSKNFDNLLLAGRLVSCTRLALGTIRLMKTGGTVGQAVGCAAGLCKRYNCSCRELYQNHIKELQQTLLKRDATIPYVINQDKDDLAKEAKITASSESYFEVTELSDFLPS